MRTSVHIQTSNESTSFIRSVYDFKQKGKIAEVNLQSPNYRQLLP